MSRKIVVIGGGSASPLHRVWQEFRVWKAGEVPGPAADAVDGDITSSDKQRQSAA